MLVGLVFIAACGSLVAFVGVTFVNVYKITLNNSLGSKTILIIEKLFDINPRLVQILQTLY